jgi:hypothetical protein
MVLGVKVILYVGGEWGEEVVRVYTESSEYWSNYVRLNFRVTVSTMPEKSPGYQSATDLFAPNYAPAAPLPSASVISYFLVDLLLRFWRRIYNEGFGSIRHYAIKLEQWTGLSIYYDVGVTEEIAWLRHQYIIYPPFAFTPISLWL